MVSSWLMLLLPAPRLPSPACSSQPLFHFCVKETIESLQSKGVKMVQHYAFLFWAALHNLVSFLFFTLSIPPTPPPGLCLPRRRNGANCRVGTSAASLFLCLSLVLFFPSIPELVSRCLLR